MEDALQFAMYFVIGAFVTLVMIYVLKLILDDEVGPSIEWIVKHIIDIFVRDRLIPENERITVDDVASQCEWKPIQNYRNSIETIYDSGKSVYECRIDNNKSGGTRLIIYMNNLHSSHDYARYTSLEKVVMDAYKMIVRHHNLSSNNSSDMVRRASRVARKND